MTENKRLRYNLKEGSIDGLLSVYEDNRKPLTHLQVLDRLNEQEKRVKRLKEENKMLKNNVNKLTGDIEYLKTLPSQHRELYKQSEIKRTDLLTENNLLKEQSQELKKELKNRKKMNNILEGFLLNKGYDYNDIIKFLQDRTEKEEKND